MKTSWTRRRWHYRRVDGRYRLRLSETIECQVYRVARLWYGTVRIEPEPNTSIRWQIEKLCLSPDRAKRAVIEAVANKVRAEPGYGAK
jgi:hypothetical protein